MQGGWVIDKAYYHNRHVAYNLLTNSFDLSKDHSCILPALQVSERHSDYEKGVWNAYEQNDTIYLHIKTINTIFNRTFKVSNYRTVTDSVSFGQLTKATLSSDSLRFECTKAPY